MLKKILILVVVTIAMVHGWMAWRYASPFPCDAAVARSLESVGIAPDSALHELSRDGIIGTKDRAVTTVAKHLHWLDGEAIKTLTGRAGEGLLACYRYTLLGD